MLLPHMVVKGKVGSIPVQFYCLSLHIKSIEIACGISDVASCGGRVHVLAVLKMVRGIFGTSCTTALQFSSQDHLA